MSNACWDMLDVAEQRIGRRRVVDAAHDERALGAGRRLQRHRAAQLQVLVLGVALGDDRAVDPELPERALGAGGPLERVEARDRRRVDAGDVFSLPCTIALSARTCEAAFTPGVAASLSPSAARNGQALVAVDDVAGVELVGDRRLGPGA